MPTPLECLRHALGQDPAAIYAAVDVEPDAWQADFLRSDAPEDAVLGGRQIGKSAAVSARTVVESWTRENQLTLITGPGERQAIELYGKVVGWVEQLGLTGQLAAKPGGTEMNWRNGSRVVAVPGNPATIRGFSNAISKTRRVRVIVEESSFASDELHNAVRPMLSAASDGRFTQLGTAFGQRGEFWKVFEQKPVGVKRYEVRADQCPRIVAKKVQDEQGNLVSWLELERQRIGDFWFEQEYLCIFHKPVGSLFSPEHIEAAITDEVRPLWAASEWVRPGFAPVLTDAAPLFA